MAFNYYRIISSHYLKIIEPPKYTDSTYMIFQKNHIYLFEIDIY